MLKVILLLIVSSVALLVFVGSVCLAIKFVAALAEQFRTRAGRKGGACSPSDGASGRTLFRPDMQGALRDALPHFSFENAAAMSRDMALIATDRTGGIVSFNRGAENFLGFRAADVKGRLAIDFVFDDTELATDVELMQNIKKQTLTPFESLVADALDGTVEERRWTWIKRNTEPLAVNLTITALRNNNGVAEGFLFLAHKWKKRLQNEADNEPAHSTACRSGVEAPASPLPEQPMAESLVD